MSRRARRWRLAGAAALGIVALLAALLVYLGAFGGEVYDDLGPLRAQRASAPETAVVLLSGDLGFRFGLGPDVAMRLGRAGLPVTGVNSLVVFRKPHTPAQIADFLAETMRRTLARTKAKRLVMIGQSFGADMLHVGLARLPEDLRRRIALVILVVPTDTVYYRISLGETYGWRRPDAMAIDTARGIDWVPLLCVQGVEEKDSLCPLLRQPNAERVALPGGHPLHRDADAVARVLLRKIDATLGGGRPAG